MFKRYSIAFWLLNLSTLLFFFSFNVIVPELSDYLSSLGGEDYKGFFIGLFTIAAALSRPISGKLTDTIGRRPIMFFGGFVCVVVALFYPWFATVAGFLFLRFMHGLSTGFMPTGAVAYLADIIPADRRGEAMGINGIMNNVGFMAGNAVSSLIKNQMGMDELFYFSGIVALFSVAILMRLKESMKQPAKFKWSMVSIKKEDVYDPRAKVPATLMFMTTISFGAALTLIPDYSGFLGVANKGLFFTIATVATLMTRLWAGKLSDRIGRLKTCMIGTSFWVISSLCLVFLQIELFYLAAVFFGLATGMNSPAIFAWAVDVAHGVRTGRAMATLFVSLELGIAVGAFAMAIIYGNEFQGMRTVYTILTLINGLALVYLLVKNKGYSPVNQ